MEKQNTGKFVSFESAEGNLHYENVLDIEPKDVEKHRAEVTLVDVRQDEEFIGELGHIPGAQLIPLNLLEEKLSLVPKDKTVVFICRSGGRSARACAFAVEHGYKNVFNMKGGMILWNELHLPTEV